MTPLLLLCRHNRTEELLPSIRQLLSSSTQRLDVNRTTRYGVSALLLLCRNYQRADLIRIVRLLAGAGIDLNACTSHWNALLLLARYYPSRHGNLFDLAWLLIRSGIQVNFTTPGGWRAIHFLCRYYGGADLIDIISFMVVFGADVNCRTTRHGYTPLVLLAQHNILVSQHSQGEHILTGMIRLLVDNGADVGVRTLDRQWNVLLTLCRFYCGDHLLTIVRHLVVEYGVDVDARASDGSSALHFLCAQY